MTALEKGIPEILRVALLFFITLITCFSLRASHISGVNISYECLGSNNYLVTVNLFRDCQDQNYLPAQLNVFIGSSCSNMGYVPFPQIDLIEVSQLCEEQLPNSTCNGGLQPGVQMGIYETTVQLPPCQDWRIVVSEQNRDGSIVNLQNPELYSLHTEAFLNNMDGNCNSSPILTLLNLPYICVGTELFYNLGFIETDGDSLSYSLVPAQASNTPVAPFNIDYVAPYSGAEPMTGMTIDPLNGQITVTPTSIGRFNAVVEVKEYRNGILIGMVHYDFLFLVNACPIPPPEPVPNSLAHVSGGGYPLDEKTIGICAEDDFCFEIAFESTEPTVNIDLRSNLNYLIPGITETVTGTNPATIQFCGTLPPDFAGGSFIVIANDDACPVYGQNFYTIDFQFRKPIKATGDATICLGESTPISAINDTVYTWYSLSGNVIPPNDEISCNPCQNPIVTPDSSTHYVVVGQYANSSCSNRDTVFVDIPLRANFYTQDETCKENDGSITIEILSGSGDYSFEWQDIGPGNEERNNLAAGNYQVTITDNVFNCTREAEFTLIKLPPPEANAGQDFEVCGLSANLDAQKSYGIPLWQPLDGASFSDPSDENTLVTVSEEGTYQFVWTEDAGGLQCFSSDTVEVTFYEKPIVEIIAADSICGLETSLEVQTSVGSLQWSANATTEFDNQNQPSTTATVQQYGTIEFYVEVENGTCSAADTTSVVFIEQPIAYAGEDLNVCGLTAQIEAVDAIGNGYWQLPNDISTTDNVENTGIEITAHTYGSYKIVRTLTHMNYCTDRDTTTVLFTEVPTVKLPADTAVCDTMVEIEFALPIGDLNWETTAGINTSSTILSPQLFHGNFGNHTAILHADNGYGCVNSDTLEINFVVQPHLESVMADTICGLEFTLNGSSIADNHYWLQPNLATILDLNIPNSNGWVDEEGNYTFYWVAENGQTCRDTAAYPFVFYNQPITQAGDDVQVCGLSYQLQATASSGILLWQDQPGLTFSNPLQPTSIVDAAWYGSHTIVVNEINGICHDSDSLVVEFISTPQILNPQWECTGIDAQFMLSFDISLGDTANYHIEGIEGELDDFHFQSFPLPSNTDVEVILSDLGFCGGDTLVGTKFCPVTTFAGFMETDTIRLCGDALVAAAPATGFALDGNDTLLYAFHDGSGASLGNVYDWNDEPNFIFTTVLDYTQTYFISAVAGNATDDGIDLNDPNLSISEGTPVEFYQLPMAEISGQISVCPYDTVFLPVELEGDLPLEIQFSISGQSHSVTAQDYDFTMQIVDSGTVSLVSVSSEFCVGNAAGVAQVEYYPIPEVSITSPNEICESDSALIIIEMEGSGPFLANVLRNEELFLPIESTADSISFYTQTGGVFSIVNFNDQHCQVSDTISTFLHVKPMPEIAMDNYLSICKEDTVLLGGEEIPGQVYQWENNPSLLLNQNSQVPYVGQSSSPFTQQDVVVVHMERNGCFDSDTVWVEIHPLPMPQIIGSSTICSGDSIWFIGYGGENYTWSPTENFANDEGIGVLFFSEQDVEIQMTATTQAGCEASAFLEVEVLEKPNAVFAISELSGCAPLEVNLLALSQNAGNDYQWNIPGATGVKNTAHNVVKFESAGHYPVSLTITSPNGCKDTEYLSDSITVHSTYADFDFFPKFPDVSKPEVYLTNHSPKGTTAKWYIDSLLIGSGNNVYYQFTPYIGGSHNICLQIIDTNFCEARLCKPITIKDDFQIYVPNAFTPNGDGLNDLFYPVLSNVDVVEYKFWITDSRGQIVFSTTDVNAKWDGSTALIDGTKYYGENKIYTWHLRAKPSFNVETKYYTGHVLLLR